MKIKFLLLMIIPIAVAALSCGKITIPTQIYGTAECQVTDDVIPMQDGYAAGWECITTPSGKITEAVRYIDGPHQGQLYSVHKDTDGGLYIERDGNKIYLYVNP